MKTKIIFFLTCLIYFSATYSSEFEELPVSFHITKADVIYYDDNSFFQKYEIYDSIENPKAYILNEYANMYIAIEKENRYAVFHIGHYFHKPGFYRDNINNKGNDELIIRWSDSDGHEDEEGGSAWSASGIIIWDIDSYECLFNFQTSENLSAYTVSNSETWVASNDCYGYEVEFDEMRITIQQIQQTHNNECDFLQGKKYKYTLTENGFVLNDDFDVFLTNFTKNRESQIALLYKPFHYSGLDTIANGYAKYWQYWYKEKIVTDWQFWEEKYFIEGFQEIDGQEFLGAWSQEDDTAEYELSLPETGLVQILIFKKIDGKWYLYEFRDWAM